jgi:23S rRNA pseudouridine1911/1915/1917 synthase
MLYRQPAVRELLSGLARPALHARSLAFDHPVTGQRLSFECEMPNDLKNLLQGLTAL